MTNPFNRGSAPGRARDNSERPGSFKSGHAKLGGRKKGTPNAISADYNKVVLEAAYRVGSDGNGKDGITGYLKWVFLGYPAIFSILFCRLLALEDCGYWQNEPPLTKDEIDEEIRRYIGIAPTNKRKGAMHSRRFEPTTEPQWPLSVLMHIAVMDPKSFGKMLVAVLPRPTAQLRRAMFKRRCAAAIAGEM
jgi:hypothetical protein